MVAKQLSLIGKILGGRKEEAAPAGGQDSIRGVPEVDEGGHTRLPPDYSPKDYVPPAGYEMQK